MVYAKEPFGGPEQVLKYLTRYTHRVAISNQRLVELADDRVTFTYKDYAAGCQRRELTLDAVEFVRRFSLHIVPKGLVRLRHCGCAQGRLETIWQQPRPTGPQLGRSWRWNTS